MLKIKWSQKLIMAVVLLGMILTVTGCEQIKTKSTESENIPKSAQIMEFYNAVSLNQSKADVDKNLGIIVKDLGGKNYQYIDPATDYGVLVLYGDEDTVLMKSLYVPWHATELATYNKSPVTEEQVNAITLGMTTEEVKQILGGNGVEFETGEIMDDRSFPVYGLGWYNSDNTAALIYFHGKDGGVYDKEFRLY